jgi:hypothetical protein
MTDQPQTRGPSDAADHSSTKAPETRGEAEERDPHPSDPRLHPGGAHPAPADPGMSSLDRDTTLSGGRSTGQEDYGRSPDAADPSGKLREVDKNS